MTLFSEKYPPINRKKTNLGVLQIEIGDAERVLRINPNTAAEYGYLKEIPLEAPTLKSVLSGQPGFSYRNSEGVVMVLTEHEMLRMFRHDLRPMEVFELHRLFGAFFETHDDFYVEETGDAVQPMDN